MHESLTPIPPHVLQHIRHHLVVISVFNADVANLRALGTSLGSPGRYEWEYREGHETLVQASVTRLQEIAQLAAEKGIDMPAVYYALGQTPDILPWSPAALAWRWAPSSHEQPGEL